MSVFFLTNEDKEELIKYINEHGGGIYIGSGEMPDGYNVQIDPTGEADDLITRKEFNQLSDTKVDLPKDADGNLIAPTEGQTLLFRADGTTYYGTPTTSGGNTGGSDNESGEDSGGSSGDDTGNDNTGGGNTGDNNAGDTSPVIEEYGKCLNNQGTREVNASLCITKPYNIDVTINAGNSIKISGKFPNVTSGYNHLLLDGVYATYYGAKEFNTDEEHTEVYKGDWGSFNQIQFTLHAESLDDSYIYLTDTGKVLFAGVNTPYYGMSYVNGESQAMTVDEDYLGDYGVSTLSLITDTTTSGTYPNVVETAKNEWLSEYDGNRNKIPLIIHTDQHATAIAPMSNSLKNIVDWHMISKVVNLGDTVNTFRTDNNPNMEDTILETYLQDMSVIPYSKRIEVFGNHDIWAWEGEGYVGLAPQNYLYKYFKNINARYFDNYGNMVVYDDNFNVKYLIVSGFAVDKTGHYKHYAIPSESITWIIKQMELVDGYDIVILSHAPFGAENATIYTPTNRNDIWELSGENILVDKMLTDLWTGRKNKISGSVTDEFNVVHNFDFTKCDSELLCGLHGHMHADGYYYVDNLLDVYFDSWKDGSQAFYFVLIDKENERLNVWKVSNVDSTPSYENYQIPFTEPTE